MSTVELTWPTETSMSLAFGRIRSWLQGKHIQLQGISSAHDAADQLIVTLRFHDETDAVRFRRGFREAPITRSGRAGRRRPEGIELQIHE